MLVLELRVGHSIKVGDYEIVAIQKSKHGLRVGFNNVPKHVPIVRSDAVKTQSNGITSQHTGPLEEDGGPCGSPVLAPTERVDEWHHEEGMPPDLTAIGITPRKPR